MFLWRRIKALFGFGDPQPVLVEEARPGDRFVVAHENNKQSRRKLDKKADKQAAKTAKKTAKKTATKTRK